jgi:hypothetical protein
MVILAAPVTDRRWIGSVIGLDLVGEVELHVPAGRLVMLLVGAVFVSIILFQIIDIIGDILVGLIFIVRGLVCQLAEEISRLWFQPSLLERRWRRGGWVVVWGGSGIVWVFGI